MRSAYSALIQATDSLDKHRLIIENDSRGKAYCDSLLPKVIALEEILQGIGFSSGIHTSHVLSRQDFDINLLSFLPTYKNNKRCYYYYVTFRKNGDCM